MRGAGEARSDVLRGNRPGERNLSVKHLAKIATLFTEESAGE